MKDINYLKQNGVNIDKSLELFGDIETYNDTLITFIDETEKKLDNIKHYKEIADMQNYSILVHSLKSDAKYFGFETLAELAYNHELESKVNHIYYVSDNFNSLEKEIVKSLNIAREYMGQETIKLKTDNFNKSDDVILVVDDSMVISNFINKLFKDSYTVILASDGMQAINNLDNPNIKAMLLDLNMPNVNGFVVLEYLKNNNIFNKFPVSIITGVGDDNIIAKAYDYPIFGVLRKPFNEKDIKDVLNKMIKGN